MCVWNFINRDKLTTSDDVSCILHTLIFFYICRLSYINPRPVTCSILHETAVASIVGCGGRPALLSGQQGRFGTNHTHHGHMTCRWKIRVAATKVRTMQRKENTVS